MKLSHVSLAEWATGLATEMFVILARVRGLHLRCEFVLLNMFVVFWNYRQFAVRSLFVCGKQCDRTLVLEFTVRNCVGCFQVRCCLNS